MDDNYDEDDGDDDSCYTSGSCGDVMIIMMIVECESYFVSERK